MLEGLAGGFFLLLLHYSGVRLAIRYSLSFTSTLLHDGMDGVDGLGMTSFFCLAIDMVVGLWGCELYGWMD